MTEIKPGRDATALADLLHHRSTVPVLAELHRSSGAKYVTLQKRLGVGRDSLRRTLGHLIGSGLVRRNPGYGHPMRPEYLLTETGNSLAAACVPLLARLRAGDAVDLGLRKWSLPIILALGEGSSRFSELRQTLPGASPRAMTMALSDLENAGLVDRRVVDQRPPRTEYRLTGPARTWVPGLRRLTSACAA